MFNIIKSSDHPSTLAIVAALSLAMAGPLLAQTPAPLSSSSAAAPEWSALAAAELDELIGPIALYPDDLIAIVLPASTFPLQVVQASRYLEERDSNSALQPDASWDDAVIALLNYPEVLALLNDDLDWTYALGEAVVYQQGDVLNAIQSFRDRAYAAGNLATDERQVVAADEGAITIRPADPEVIYVPYYDPARVVVHSRVPAYYYYPYAYPSYYYPYPAGYSFGSGFFWGVTTAFLVSWPDHYLHVRHNSHYGHPYYGYNYYTPWYARTNVYVNVNHYGNYDRWQPSYRHGGRPRHPASYSRLRDSTVVRTPSERRNRSGWVANRPDASGSNRPRGAVANRGLNDGSSNRQPRAEANGSVDDGRARRIRSGRYDANDLSARNNPGSDANGRIAANNTRARSGSTGTNRIGDNDRRPRGTAAADASTDASNRASRSRTGRLETRGDTRPTATPSEGSASRGRFQSRDSGTTPGVRVAPQRGANSAAAGQQNAQPSARIPQRGSTPTFGRVAPAERTRNQGRSGMRREQPMSPPSTQRQARTPTATFGGMATQRAPNTNRSGIRREQPMSAPNAQRQTRTPSAGLGGRPTQRAPNTSRSGMRREQPMSAPSTQRQARAPAAAVGQAAPAPQQNRAARGQARGNAQASGQPGGGRQNRRTK